MLLGLATERNTEVTLNLVYVVVDWVGLAGFVAAGVELFRAGFALRRGLEAHGVGDGGVRLNGAEFFECVEFEARGEATVAQRVGMMVIDWLKL